MFRRKPAERLTGWRGTTWSACDTQVSSYKDFFLSACRRRRRKQRTSRFTPYLLKSIYRQVIYLMRRDLRRQNPSVTP